MILPEDGSVVCVGKVERNPDFVALLREMAEIHDRKSQDYAQDNNVYSNFEYAAAISAAFTDPVDRVFATMIGVKLARLAELGKGKVPNNESVEDSHKDLSVYTVIWAAYKRSKARVQTTLRVPSLRQ